MTRKEIMRIILLLLITVSLASSTVAANTREMERLNRGLVAVHTGSDGVYLSWRLLGTDPGSTAFYIYRDGKKLTSSPITYSTNYVEARG